MVFLVEDFVNLPRDQIANIWIAAHMKKNLKKKDITKTKLGEACEALHGDNTKKEMPLRHYGQCIVGISYIHLKQVEYLHSDCNEAFSKARLILVRKRKVDLDPAKEKGNDRDITLPDKGNENEQLIIDLNNSQVILMDDDNISEVGSLLGTVSNNSNDITLNDNLALDHEITMQQNELLISPSRNRNNHNLGDRRSSFGGTISALDIGDMDIEMEFDDDDIDQQQNNMGILDESQAKRANLDHLASLTDDDTDNQSVEQGRGANNNNTLLQQQDNISIDGSISILQQQQNDDMISNNGSHVSLQKVDNLSVHSGSIDNNDNNNNVDINIMDIDNNNEDNQSLHVQFDLDDIESMTGSVATDALIQNENEEATPPPSPSANGKRKRKDNNSNNNNKSLNKKKRKKKKKNKKKFVMDKVIHLDNNDLRETNPANFDFTYPGGRDPIHIWREFPLSSLNFEDLLLQPLSKQDFGRFPQDICQKFEECNKKRIIQRKDKSQSADTDIDELADPNILRENSDIEQGRDDINNLDNDVLPDIDLPMNDFSMINNDENMDNNNDQHSRINEPSLEFNVNNDDNASTLDSVVDDRIAPPNDPLFDNNLDISNLEIPPINDNDDNDNDDDDDIKIDEDDSNRLSFDSGDQNKLTQTDIIEKTGYIKPRDWSKRAQKTFAFFKRKEGKEFSFDHLMKSQNKRETVVGIFYELLVFKNSGLMELEQDEPYGDITISKTNNFYQHAALSQKFKERLSQFQASQQNE